MWFIVLMLLILPFATLPSSLFRVLVDRCSCSGVRFIGFECDDFSAYRQRSYECNRCTVIVVGVCISHHFYVFDVYRNTDLSDKIIDCLLTDMAKVQSVEKSAFLLRCSMRIMISRLGLLRRFCTLGLHVTASSSDCKWMVAE